MRHFPVITAAFLLLAAAVSPNAQPTAGAGQARERISINDDWRFTKDDPPGNQVSLLYDVRPEVSEARDDRPADAEPEAAARARATVPTIKAWILPTGNAFIKDAARRHTRPNGNPGAGCRLCAA